VIYEILRIDDEMLLYCIDTVHWFKTLQ